MTTSKNMTVFASLLAVFLFIDSEIYSQGSSDIKNPKNSIQLDLASLKFIGMCSINYERMMLQSPYYKLSIIAGFGGWYFTNISKWYYGYSFPISLNNILGSGNNHFETDLGLRYTILSNKSDKDKFQYFPILNLGYRYQRPDGKGIIFRTFIGLSGLGIGIGKAF